MTLSAQAPPPAPIVAGEARPPLGVSLIIPAVFFFVWRDYRAARLRRAPVRTAQKV